MRSVKIKDFTGSRSVGGCRTEWPTRENSLFFGFQHPIGMCLWNDVYAKQRDTYQTGSQRA